MSVEVLLARLEKVRASGGDSWRAQCPCGHASTGQMSIKLLSSGSILIHCHAGHSPMDIVEAMGLSMSDLFEKPLDQHIRPLYMAQKEKKDQSQVDDKMQGYDLRLEMAVETREQGGKLSVKDLETERKAWVEKRKLQLRLQ
tara:strand:+ start:1446 stop:1871 length:426 start_codon:yes stop_codon:yes gene_type:complete